MIRSGFTPGPVQVVRPVHAHETVRMPPYKPIPFVEPHTGDVIRRANLESDGRVEYVNAGAAQLLKVGAGECRRYLKPPVKQRPVQSKEAEHVDYVRLGDEIDGASRKLVRRGSRSEQRRRQQ